MHLFELGLDLLSDSSSTNVPALLGNVSDVGGNVSDLGVNVGDLNGNGAQYGSELDAFLAEQASHALHYTQEHTD